MFHVNLENTNKKILIFLKKLSHTTVIILVLILSVHVVLSIKYTITLSSQMEYMWNRSKCREGTDWNKLKQINFKFTEQRNYQLKMIHKITHRVFLYSFKRHDAFFTLQINAWALSFTIWKHEQLRIFTTRDIWKFFQNYCTHLEADVPFCESFQISLIV